MKLLLDENLSRRIVPFLQSALYVPQLRGKEPDSRAFSVIAGGKPSIRRLT